jgi:hypothetical protein
MKKKALGSSQTIFIEARSNDLPDKSGIWWFNPGLRNGREYAIGSGG